MSSISNNRTDPRLRSQYSFALRTASLTSLLRSPQRRLLRSFRRKNTKALSMGNLPIQKPLPKPARPYEHVIGLRRRRPRRHFFDTSNKPSIMLQLIARREWQKVLIRASIAPSELSQKQTLSWYGIDAKVLPLHLACALQPPPQVIEKLLYFHTDTASMTMTKSRSGGGAKKKNKRQLSFRRNNNNNRNNNNTKKKDLWTIRKSNTDPTTSSNGTSSVENTSESRGMVLQLSATGNLQPVPIAQPSKMQWDLKPLLNETDCLLPLHVACLYQAPPGVLSHLLEASPDSAKVVAWGMLPIHMICANFGIPPPIAAPAEFIQLASEFKLADCLQILIQNYPESVHIKSIQNGMTPSDYIEETMDDGKMKTHCLRALDGEEFSDDYEEEEEDHCEERRRRNVSFDTMTDTMSSNSEEQISGVPLEIHCFENMPAIHMDFDEAEDMRWHPPNPLYSALQGEEWEEAYYLLEDEPQLVNQWQYGIEIDDYNEPQLWKRLPLHNACRFGAPLGLLSMMLQLTTTYKADPYTGSLPIHLACQYSPCAETIQLLLCHDSGCAKEKNNRGQLPMHLICLNKAMEARAIQLLIKAFPGAVNYKDKDGKRPLDYAGESLDSELYKVMERLQAFLERVEQRKQQEERERNNQSVATDSTKSETILSS
mmetsp:Transcript_4445/g.5149  ORF Transcript_4445/g.5149 Transcript_4445/m.5149 type:complete len:656 (+) Transcript_4445:143-2110(+)